MQKSNPHPNGASFIPITINGDTDPVTEGCTVTFEATASDASEPDLTLSFFEVKQTSPSGTTLIPITVSNPPTPVWSNGIAVFALAMNTAIFSQLSSRTTHFSVEAAIDGDPDKGWGTCVLGISLTEGPTGPGGGS